MAFFKKRRRSPAGPNKNEKKVLRGHSAENMARVAGRLGQRFPAVQKMTVNMDFLTPEGHLMDQQKQDWGPADPCQFLIPCPGRCGDGTFDLEAKIASIVQARQGQAASMAICPRSITAGSTAPCGLRLQCRIDVAYVPDPR